MRVQCVFLTIIYIKNVLKLHLAGLTLLIGTEILL